MSESIVRAIIEERIEDDWVLTPVDWDNVKYIPTRGTAFISPIINETDSTRTGFSCITRMYTLLIEVRAPRNAGTVTIDGLTQALKTLFEGYEEGNFYCLKGRTERAGGNKNWFQKNVIFTCKYKTTS